jgi:hypothetical protein
MATVHVLVPDGIKPKRPLGTGLTDGPKTGIGAFNVLLPRDDVKCARAKSSASVEPMTVGAYH